MSDVDRMFADSTEKLPPQVLLPVQYFRPARGAAGERALMAAVLEDAIRVHSRYAGRHFARSPRVFVEVQSWFQSRSKVPVFAFERICEELHVNAGYIRRLIAARERPIANPTYLGRLAERVPVERALVA